jgi:hypothetical protein
MARPKTERIMTLHPAGRSGVNIEKARYETMRRALLKVIPRRAEGVAFRDLPQLVRPHLDREVFGKASVSWYVTTVKLDLEARALIERVPRKRPQHLRRKR